MADPIIVERGSVTERVIRVPLKNDEKTEAIFNWKFRYNVVRTNDLLVGGQFFLFSLVPVIEDPVERLIKISFGVVQTGLQPTSFPGVLLWRKDGVDPTTAVNPFDFEPIGFEIVDKLLATP